MEKLFQINEFKIYKVYDHLRYFIMIINYDFKLEPHFKYFNRYVNYSLYLILNYAKNYSDLSLSLKINLWMLINYDFKFIFFHLYFNLIIRVN
jgi:hypothetical protein